MNNILPIEININDLIKQLEDIYNNCNHFENVIIDILENLGFDNETISSLITLNDLSRIQSIIDILKTL